MQERQQAQVAVKSSEEAARREARAWRQAGGEGGGIGAVRRHVEGLIDVVRNLCSLLLQCTHAMRMAGAGEGGDDKGAVTSKAAQGWVGAVVSGAHGWVGQQGLPFVWQQSRPRCGSCSMSCSMPGRQVPLLSLA